MTDTPSAIATPGTNLRPKGPNGLWSALASVAAPAIGARALPLSDTTVAAAQGSMFDYDPALAVECDGWGQLPVGS